MSKKYLWLYFAMSMLFIPLLSTSAWAASLHAIIVADVNDKGIGADQDVAAIQKLTDTTRRATCLGGQDVVVHAGRGKSQEVNKTISDLSVSSDDVVFFYYSGHGANLRGGDRWPVMGVEGQTGANHLKLSDVEKALQSKNPRLLITMADACNKFISGAGVTQRGRKEEQKAIGFKKLFLSYKGSIIASSSSPDQFSYGDPQNGGGFTRQFLRVLNEVQASSNPNWESIKTMVTKDIPVNTPQKVQTPQMKVELAVLSGKRGLESHNNEWNCAVDPGATPIIDSPSREPAVSSPSSDYPACASGKFKVENGQDCCLDRSGKKTCFNQ